MCNHLSNIAHITRGYATPHKALVLDSNKDISGIRQVTMDDKSNGLFRFANLVIRDKPLFSIDAL